jgi:hypothetical protein
MLQAWAVREDACHTERPNGWGRLQQPQASRSNPKDVTGKHRQQRLRATKKDGEQV